MLLAQPALFASPGVRTKQSHAGIKQSHTGIKESHTGTKQSRAGIEQPRMGVRVRRGLKARGPVRCVDPRLF